MQEKDSGAVHQNFLEVETDQVPNPHLLSSPLESLLLGLPSEENHDALWEQIRQLQQTLTWERQRVRIGDRLRELLDPDQIMRTVVQELVLSLQADYCNAALFQSDQTELATHYEYTRLSPSLGGKTWRLQDFPDLHSQLSQGSCLQVCLLHAAPVTILICPLLDQASTLGNLCLFNPVERGFGAAEVWLVEQVILHCAIALRQARLYQEARSQVRELEHLNRLKDDFLSTVSHELRTPVSNMKMAIHMLKTAPNQERRDRYLNILQAECAREAELVNDLLDLQRLEAASYPIFLVEAIQLQAWLPEILEPFRTRFQERQQVVQCHWPSDLPTLISDRGSLSRILAELFNNACKYTPAGGKIILRVRQTPYFSTDLQVQGTQAYTPTPAMTISLSNEVEIPAIELPRLFEKFYRVPNSDPWKQGGTGLGLALVQRLVERLKGSIQVESAAGWTTFHLQLPLQSEPGATSDCPSPA